jgi:hypothetical protein
VAEACHAREMKKVLFLVLGACGGVTTTIDGGGADAGADTTTTTVDGGSDAGLVAPCPSSAPLVGAACSGDVSCEYGTSNDPMCNKLFSCGGQGWYVGYDGSGCDYSGTNDPACPTTYAATTGACSASSSVCEYSDGRCICVTSCGGVALPDAGLHWECSGTSAPCPSPRDGAKIGAACNTPGTYCQYGVCCSGANQECTDAGVWEGTIMQGGCP